MDRKLLCKGIASAVVCVEQFTHPLVLLTWTKKQETSTNPDESADVSQDVLAEKQVIWSKMLRV